MHSQNTILATLAALALTPLAVAQDSLGELSPQAAAALRSSINDSLYRVDTTSDGSPEAANPAQQMRSRFEQEGIELSGQDWSLGLSLEAWGRAGALSTADGGERVTLGRRVEYRRGNLVEWYVNDERGLEPVPGDVADHHRHAIARQFDQAVVVVAGRVFAHLVEAGDGDSANRLGVFAGLQVTLHAARQGDLAVVPFLLDHRSVQLRVFDGEGGVNAVDVQLVINGALGLSIDFDADVNGDGFVNALDVQIVINAALGI